MSDERKECCKYCKTCHNYENRERSVKAMKNEQWHFIGQWKNQECCKLAILCELSVWKGRMLQVREDMKKKETTDNCTVAMMCEQQKE